VARIYPDYAVYTDYFGEQIVSQLLMLKMATECCVNEFTEQHDQFNMSWTPTNH